MLKQNNIFWLITVSMLWFSCQNTDNKSIEKAPKLPDSVNLSSIDTSGVRSIRCDSLQAKLNQLIAAHTFVNKSNIRNAVLNDFGQTNLVYFFYKDSPENGRCCSFRPYLLRISEPNNEPSFLLSRVEVLKMGHDSIVVREIPNE